MDKPRKTEAEQIAFFNDAYERFESARETAGGINHFYRVGDTTVCLSFAGCRLIPHLAPALEHLRLEACQSPDVTFCVWDSESTGTDMIPPPFGWDRFTDRGDIWGLNSRRIKTAFHWIECSVNLMDLERKTAIYWIKTAETLPYWVHASPLRTLFHWWMESNGCQLLHAASVGTKEGAVLITGKGGVGKSTTALSCLKAGLSYIGDDYVIARLEPHPLVYSLYCTAKLNADQVQNFPDLAGFVKNPHKLDQEKAVMFLFPHKREQILSEMPMKAILTPRVMNEDETAFSPVDHWTIQRAMSFTTMSQLPCVGRHTHEFIGRLSGVLAGYTLELGRDVQKIPEAVSEFISCVPRHQPVLHPGRDVTGSTEAHPLVSVIIPVYNGEDFIGGVLEHIVSQNYPALEIIVVDDGSTDRTAEIIGALTIDVRYFKQPNEGPASARNRGIRDASAELLVFLDVDDLWPNNNLHLLVNEMRNQPDADVFRGYAQIMDYNSETDEYEFVGNPVEAFPDYIGAALYRKAAFEKVGLFDSTLRYGEDSDWFKRAEESQLHVKRLEDITLLVRRHRNNMTRGKNLLELGKLRVFKKSIDRERAKKQCAVNNPLHLHQKK